MAMISLTRLNGQPFVLNALLIETVEATPDTVITTTTHKKYIVQEDVEEVVKRVTQFLAKSGVHSVLQSNANGG